MLTLIKFHFIIIPINHKGDDYMNNTSQVLDQDAKLDFEILDQLKEAGHELISGSKQSCNNNC